MTGEVSAVQRHGSVSVLYVVSPTGAELAIACEPRMADALQQALDYGERPLIDFESWQVLWPSATGAPVHVVT